MQRVEPQGVAFSVRSEILRMGTDRKRVSDGWHTPRTMLI